MGLAGTCCLRARPVLGGGAFAGHQATRFRPLALAAAMLHMLASLPLLLLLAMPAPTHAWSRPLWYQVGLDLQPWGCQPKSMEGCRGGLSCPGYWLGPGASRIYPVAGVMITTTMLMICRKILQGRRCSQATKGEHPQVTTEPCGPWKRRAPISDHTLLRGVLHMLDALLVHIEGHLHHLATQRQIQIKGTSAQSG
ncbi:transmembrane protein 89 [Macaca thibetana thibetana]|uniref:transmembrane protein 89 n=1 Tax=Macaca thibetana thibetana TaxID=257877 RepID=UPI0021BCE6CA|nr:transmembrane protein 89 [Macaca thibetana thibetana]